MAAITEAMAFCQFLDVDVELMYDIVVNAAGNSKVFAGCFRGMQGKGWRVEGLEQGGEVVGRLVSLIFFFFFFFLFWSLYVVYFSLSRARALLLFPYSTFEEGGTEGDGSMMTS